MGLNKKMHFLVEIVILLFLAISTASTCVQKEPESNAIKMCCEDKVSKIVIEITSSLMNASLENLQVDLKREIWLKNILLKEQNLEKYEHLTDAHEIIALLPISKRERADLLASANELSYFLRCLTIMIENTDGGISDEVCDCILASPHAFSTPTNKALAKLRAGRLLSPTEARLVVVALKAGEKEKINAGLLLDKHYRQRLLEFLFPNVCKIEIAKNDAQRRSVYYRNKINAGFKRDSTDDIDPEYFEKKYMEKSERLDDLLDACKNLKTAVLCKDEILIIKLCREIGDLIELLDAINEGLFVDSHDEKLIEHSIYSERLAPKKIIPFPLFDLIMLIISLITLSLLIALFFLKLENKSVII